MDISLLDKIIFDGNTFLDFIHKEKQFQDINIDMYIKKINDYMNYLINNNTSLTKEVFNRMNYLNKLFNTKITYDYMGYLKKGRLVTNSMVWVILKKEDILNKFLDFKNNRKYFLNIPIEEYLKAMDKMISYYDKKNITIPKQILINFKKVMNKYSLYLKKKQILYGTVINEPLDKSLENKVMEDVNLSDDAFFVARQIYINLCKQVTFDINFFSYGSTLENEINRGIWNRDIAQINPKDNRVICNTFGKTYASLLNKIGIEARLVGEFHKHNFLDADGTLIGADATAKIVSNNLALYDIARVQMGLGTAGFRCYDKHKDIDDMLKRSNSKINYKQKTIEELIEESKLKTFDLGALNYICQNSSMIGLELVIYIKLLLTKIFKGSIQIKYISIKKDDINFEAYLLILYEGIYYLLGKEGISYIQMEELNELEKNNKIKYFNNKGKNIFKR